MTIKHDDEIEVYKEEIPPDIDKIKKVFLDLKSDTCHSPPLVLPCCLHHRYKRKPGKRGRTFDEESFFLEWLADEIRFSKIKAEFDIIYKDEFDREPGESPITEIYRFDMREYFKAPKIYKEVVDFIKKHLPNSDINLDLERIKMKIYRVRKSGIVNELEREILLEQLKIHPMSPEKKIKQKKTWQDLKFAQRVADFIYSLPDKLISQRDLLRHFSNKRKEDFERIHDYLKLNYRINFRKEGYRNKTTIYYSTAKSSKGRYWKVGI